MKFGKGSRALEKAQVRVLALKIADIANINNWQERYLKE